VAVIRNLPEPIRDRDPSPFFSQVAGPRRGGGSDAPGVAGSACDSVHVAEVRQVVETSGEYQRICSHSWDDTFLWGFFGSTLHWATSV
jgi:hypothetical protein